MEAILEILQVIAYIIVEYVVYFLFAFAMAYVIKFIKEKEFKEIVEEAVIFAQRNGKKYGLTNEEKFEEAVQYIKDTITLRFNLDDKRVEGLIEATLKRLKKEFQDQW